MVDNQAASPPLPTLNELGVDLLATSRLRLTFALVAPFACSALYWGCALRGWWVPAVAAVAMLSFFTYGSTSHDLVHGTLPLPRWANDVLLSLTEIIALRSGHAYRISHLQHHRHLASPDDAEGAPAHMGPVRALLAGPVYIPKLWAWSARRAKARERGWIAAETFVCVAFVIAALWLWPHTPAPLVYAALTYGASWGFPILLVVIPHDVNGRGALLQTRAFRGRVIPALLLQHTYHLEHHLYPRVPSHQWRALAARLDPVFEQRGVRPIRIL